MQGGEGDKQAFSLGDTAVDSSTCRDLRQPRVDEFSTKDAGGFIERDVNVLKIEECVSKGPIQFVSSFLNDE